MLAIKKYDIVIHDIGVLLNNKDNNTDKLKEMSEILRRNRDVINRLSTKKIIQKINDSSSNSEIEYLKSILEEKQKYQQNSDMIEDIINCNYDGVKVISSDSSKREKSIEEEYADFEKFHNYHIEKQKYEEIENLKKLK